MCCPIRGASLHAHALHSMYAAPCPLRASCSYLQLRALPVEHRMHQHVARRVLQKSPDEHRPMLQTSRLHLHLKLVPALGRWMKHTSVGRSYATIICSPCLPHLQYVHALRLLQLLEDRDHLTVHEPVRVDNRLQQAALPVQTTLRPRQSLRPIHTCPPPPASSGSDPSAAALAPRQSMRPPAACPRGLAAELCQALGAWSMAV